MGQGRPSMENPPAQSGRYTDRCGAMSSNRTETNGTIPFFARDGGTATLAQPPRVFEAVHHIPLLPTEAQETFCAEPADRWARDEP